MYETIVAAIDGSDTAYRAASHAVDLAAEVGGTVHIVFVLESKPTLTAVGLSGLEDTTTAEDYREYAHEHIGRVREQAEAKNVGTVSAVLQGRPALEIIEYAADEDVDLIVVGAHGEDHGAITSAILGSNTERVVRRAETSVLVAR